MFVSVTARLALLPLSKQTASPTSLSATDLPTCLPLPSPHPFPVLVFNTDGITYLFVSNSDNLGATLDTDLLAYFAHADRGFLMEVRQQKEGRWGSCLGGSGWLGCAWWVGGWWVGGAALRL